MKQFNFIIHGISILVFLISPHIAISGGSVQVKGHFRKDGTYVQPHYRSAPDSSFYNNWSTKGNFNPYTGEEGTVDSPPLKSGTGVPSQIYIPVFTGNSSSTTSATGANVDLPSANINPSIPENSYRSGNAWYCNSGYRRVGDKCDALNVPANAYVSGNAWYCNSGYRRVGDECRKLNVPENAYVSGNAWYCNSGYRRVGDKCDALNVPANAYVSGNAWYCNNGYRRVGEECIKLKPGEEPRVIPTYGYRSYSYSVSGYGDEGSVYGDIDADGSRDVSGYLYLEDGTEVYFDGEWVGKGEVEGYDEDGNYYELEVE